MRCVWFCLICVALNVSILGANGLPYCFHVRLHRLVHQLSAGGPMSIIYYGWHCQRNSDHPLLDPLLDTRGNQQTIALHVVARDGQSSAGEFSETSTFSNPN